MKISAVTIARNEAENLPQWLKSVKQYADEIIVVDTGSEDATVEIAREGGARVEFFAWCNDFAAAKNFGIEQASGDWIAFLDADEYFDDTDAPKVRSLLSTYHNQPRVVAITLKLVNIDKDTGKNMGTSFPCTRLFRNVPWIRYVGSIHENLRNITPEKEAEMKLVSWLRIYHTGYSASVIKLKSKRNLDMILDRQKRIGFQPLDDYHLMDSYYSLADYEKAIYHAKRAAADRYQPLGTEQRIYMVWLQCMMLINAPADEFEEILREAREKFPQAAAYWFLAGSAKWKSKDYLGAEREFMEGLLLYERNGCEDDSAERLLPMTYEYLGEICYMQHRFEDAKAFLMEGLRWKKQSSHMLWMLLGLWQGDAEVEIIQRLNKLYDRTQDAEFLVQVLSRTTLYQATLYYDRLAGNVLGDVGRYLRSGHANAAVAGLVTELERSYVAGHSLARILQGQAASLMEYLLPPVYRQEGEASSARMRKRLERMRKYWMD